MTTSAAAIRRRLRRPPPPWRFRLAGWYGRLVNAAIVGAIAWGVAVRGLQKTGQEGASEWTALCLSVVAAVVLLKGLLAFGPVFAGRDRLFWVLSSPVDRAALLAPRFAGLLGFGAAVGAVWPAAVLGVVGAPSPPGWAVFAGSAVAGVAVVAGAVVVQRSRVRVQGLLTGVAVVAVAASVLRPDEVTAVVWPAPVAVLLVVAVVAGAVVQRSGVRVRGLVAGLAVVAMAASVLRPGDVTVVVRSAAVAVLLVVAVVAGAVEQRSRVRVRGVLTGVAVVAVAASVLRPGDATASAVVWPAAAAVLLVVAAAASLRRLRRSDLTAGAALAAAVRVSVAWLDLGLLGALLAERRARLRGRVRSARLRGPRAVVLVWTDVLRARRAPGSVLVWAGLLPVPALVALGGEVEWVPAVHLVCAFAAADRLAAGLRTVCRLPAVRRALGVPDGVLRLAHLVVPGTAAVAWCLATVPFTPHVSWLNGAVSALGAVAVVYRVATRPPLDYGVAAIDFGVLGPVPLGLLVQLSRGPVLLYLLCVVQVLLG
ncbi:hypothetical protein SAMN05216188_10676 [Lentzea xinjiangensis]|uniref:Uncharacterized protein n=1 Tax=Lentzea xinjiangensis TaxID=402600 RepID=A0A1H9JN09_9PSEU|nr:DUF6297 family protein [Lentzea xinjiangensis]SEQ88321.1 hypothetical protein SAMN05216188_10676 [Lentzea xinjiangensis]